MKVVGMGMMRVWIKVLMMVSKLNGRCVLDLRMGTGFVDGGDGIW